MTPGEAPTTATPEHLTYHFDPGCPWTWTTTLWLDHVSQARGIPVRWRSFSVALLHEPAPDEEESPRALGARLLLRVVEALLAAGEEALVRLTYLEYGRRVHVDREEPDAQLVRAVAEAVGAGAHAGALEDAELDDGVRTSTEAALALVGGEVGSPILLMDEPPVGLFGPILSPAPSGERAEALFDLVVAAARTPELFELKRGRTARPAKRLEEPVVD